MTPATHPVTFEEVLRELEEIRHQTKKSLSDRVWDVSSKIIVAVVMASLGWLFALSTRVEVNDDRLTIIENTRFTEKAARDMEARLTSMITTNDGPRWLSEAVLRLERATDRMDSSITSLATNMQTKFDALTERVNSLEVKLAQIAKDK